MQGERPMADQNKEIGRFDLTDLPPSPRGMPQIEVSFDIDADGILHVHAKDLSTGKEQKIRIQAKSGLDENEIKNIIKDAELHAEEDKKRKEAIDVKNECDAVVFRAEKALRDYKDKIPSDIATGVQNKIDVAKKACESNDTQAIKHIGEAMAKAGNAQGHDGHAAQGPEPTETKAQGDENTIEDAEVEIIDKDENNK
jgi:molecular chaperone DnaK